MLKNDIGFYSVEGKNFSNKFDAVLEAQLTNKTVNWNFFDDIFKKVDWKTEPEIELDQFYKIRAEQIREAYDYVIVFCSGGADSTNVIKSFINNNIKVDEVIGIAPLSGLKNWEYDPKNVSDLNVISETKFALFPLLDELTTVHGIKATIFDFFEDILNYTDEEWTFSSCGNIVTPLTSHFTKVDSIPHIRKLIESGKRIALVYGTDKPVLKIDTTGNILFVLSDGGVNYLNTPDSRSYPNVDRVLFYWTPDLPSMLVKQAHVVSKLVQLPQFKDIYENEVCLSKQDIRMSRATFQDIIDYNEQNNLRYSSKEEIFNKFAETKKTYVSSSQITSSRSIYQRAIVPYIYPSTFSKNLWQSQKVDLREGFFTRDQDWIHLLHKNTRISDMVLAGTKALYSSIKPRYLNHKGTGFQNINKVYSIGNLSNF